MQLGETSQDVGRRVGVAAIAHRPVFGVIDPDIRHAIENPLQRNSALDPGERGAGAGVHAARERDVLADIAAVEPELVRTVEASGIAVDGTQRDHDGGASASRDGV